MAQVSVTVNGRRYTVGCQDGQEDHLSGLAGYVNQKIEELKAGGVQLGEAHFMLMASLLIADELHEALLDLEDGDKAPAADQAAAALAEEDASPQSPAALSELEAEKIALALDACASRLETVAQRLEND